RAELSPAAGAQLLGLEAEHAARTAPAIAGPFVGGAATQASGEDVARAYEEAARAWEAQGRAHDAAESRLEGLLSRARQPGSEARVLEHQFSDIRSALGDAGFGEHAALAELVRGSIAHAAGDEETARRALDAAIDLARQAGRREWAWQGGGGGGRRGRAGSGRGRRSMRGHDSPRVRAAWPRPVATPKAPWRCSKRRRASCRAIFARSSGTTPGVAPSARRTLRPSRSRSGPRSARAGRSIHRSAAPPKIDSLGSWS